MPGKSTTRTSINSRLSSKLSTQTLTSSGRSTVSLSVPDEGPSNSLRTRICDLFGDAQKTTAGHRKLVVGLRKVQEQCLYELPTTHRKKGQEQQHFEENDFTFEFTRCVIRLMGVKKSEGVGDRLVKFTGSFLQYASEKDVALVPESEFEDTQSLPETATSRLTTHILSIVSQFLISKEKTTRYRATQLVAHIINSLDSVDDNSYHLLKVGLLKRIRDKEPTIRVQAVMGLGRLAGNEDDADTSGESSDNELECSGLLEKLLDTLQNDPSADVRRSLLLNLPLTPGTLPYLLERARDLDSATRRALYSRLLPALGDFRHLSLSMREKLLRWGLRDRDENVRKATARLFRERWIEDCTRPRQSGQNCESLDAAEAKAEGLLELLERIDVVNSGIEGGVACEAMKEFWEGRPDYRNEVRFTETFWECLTPESVFLARTLNDFCRGKSASKYEVALEEKLPEVMELAFLLQKYTNKLMEMLKKNYARGRYEGEDDTVEQEFVVEQLLQIAMTLDFSDEMGRRKMFALLREMLAIAELPDEITKLAVDVLRGICGKGIASEREFCGVVLEAVAEVHDAIAIDEHMVENEDESFHSARSEISGSTPSRINPVLTQANDQKGEADEDKAIREILINMRCLHIAQCMLQNVEGNLQQNVHLVTMLNNLVVPAVRSHEALLRERGLLCLGLCCLLDKDLAKENITLFQHCFAKGHNALQVTAIHILADILETYPTLLKAESADPDLQRSLLRIFGKGLKAQQTPEVQSAAIAALCKLMLTSVINDEDLLKQAVICLFDPATRENAAVRQALSYSLPVYCHSRRDNMERMANVAGAVMHAVVNLSEELEEDEEMVGINIVGNMLVDWTDARKLVVQDEASVSWDEAGKTEVKAANGDIHLVLAESLLERALDRACSKEDRKAVLAMLGKLYISSNSTTERLQTTNKLVIEAIDQKIASDATSRTALNKLHLALGKALGERDKTKKEADGSVLPVNEGGLMSVEENGAFAPREDDDIRNMDVEDESITQEGDSILEELLKD